MNVLIIEDDPKIVESIKFIFQVGWPEAQIISTKYGEEGLDIIENKSPQLVILDLGLPDMDGFEVLKQIRLFSSIPVVILTISEEEQDIVKGLELGADEYITKPFKPLVLIARIKKVIKTRDTSIPSLERHLRYGQTDIFISAQNVTIDGRTMKLTSTEALILNDLVSKAGSVVSYQAIAQHIWGAVYPEYHGAIRVYIRQLRKKIENDPDNPQWIINRPNTGYMLTKPDIQ